ncbi:MAG: hypothetical protein HY590_03770 [Candidatus Omnitrophica bacterium]|nr:hypothetical protein [Candidatus Omnitrophota bacterium]
MTYQHQSLAEGRWNRLSFCEQMAHIGSEVERALNWRAKKNATYSRQAAERALELLDLTLNSVKGLPRLKEVARVRETLVDYFAGTNEYRSTEESWKKYFLSFTYAARKTY